MSINSTDLMNKVRYIIVDDERLAQKEMKLMMDQYKDFFLVGEASNAEEAEKLIISLNPDLLILDIQMPEKSGIDLLLSLDHVPEVIFLTAFDHYAVKAFELNAIDYLLKPLRKERLALAIDKIREKHSAKMAKSHVFIKDGNHMHLIKIASIYLIESIGNYARIYFDDKKVFYKRSLNQLEKTLDPDLFFRINRSQIININFIEKIEQLADSRLSICLKNRDLFIVSNRQSAVFKSKTIL